MQLLVVAFTLVAAVFAFEEIELDYHNVIGVPKAQRIKNAENAIDFDGSRIAGGTFSRLGQFPYYGGLVVHLNDGRTSACGSSLVSNTRAVTAAHCWRAGGVQAVQFTVVLASIALFSGGTRINTSNVHLHENYNEMNVNNDIAIIFLSWVNFGVNINRINLATGSNLFAGTWAVACGFGATDDETLLIPMDQVLSHVSLQVITNAVCVRSYGSSIVINSTLCVATPNGQSTCGGDSGGPLAVGNTLIGVTSFGPRMACTRGIPAGFARVTSFASWILARL